MITWEPVSRILNNTSRETHAANVIQGHGDNRRVVGVLIRETLYGVEESSGDSIALQYIEGVTVAMLKAE